MKKFIIKILSMAAVIAILYGYNDVTAERIEADAIAKEEADAANAAVSAQNAENAAKSLHGWSDGTYEGSAMGYAGDIVVSVTVTSGEMSDITIVSAELEDGAYFEMAQDIVDDILDAQSVDVDTISGATFSSTGIRDAVETALEAAK